MESLRRIAPGAYGVAALLFLITVVDYLGNAWPFRPGDVDWRYGVVGMVSTYLLSPLLGCLIASATAAWLPQPKVSKLLARWVTTTSFLLASAKIFSAAVVLIVLGRGNLRAAGEAPGSVGPRKREPSRPIVGQS